MYCIRPANRSRVLCGPVQKLSSAGSRISEFLQSHADGCGHPVRQSNRLRQIAEQTASVYDNVSGNSVAERMKKSRRAASHKYRI